MNPTLPNRFDPANAAALCRASKDAYALRPAHFIDHRPTDTRAILSTTETDLIIAFRGTRSLANFVTDASCERTPLYPGAKAEVHAGFQRAFAGLREQLSESVVKLLSGRRGLRLWFTGHSLGGALAKLAALHFASPWTSVYTFGEPRVGNAAFRDLYESQLGARTFRVVHADDVVPRLPWLLGAYRHCGHEVFYPCARPASRSLSMADSPLLQATATARPDDEAAHLPLKRDGWKLDPSACWKLPWDIRNGARELWHGKIALLEDHHIDTYRALFQKAGRRARRNVAAPRHFQPSVSLP